MLETYTVKDEHGNMVERKRSVPAYSNIHSTGPDKDGHYDSYSIILENPSSDEYKHRDESLKTTPMTDLKPILPFGTINEHGQYVLIFRQMGIAHSKRRVRTVVQKIETYLNQRRSKIVIQEEKDLNWKGIVGLVVGLFGVLVTILFGQLLEEEEEIRLQTVRRQKQIQRQRQTLRSRASGSRPSMAGPGVRRQVPSASSTGQSSSLSSASSMPTPRYAVTAPTQRKVASGKAH